MCNRFSFNNIVFTIFDMNMLVIPTGYAFGDTLHAINLQLLRN
jgi:hypothetical protein